MSECVCVPATHYTRVVTPTQWRAPETIIEGGGEHVSKLSDIYMLGGTFVEVLTGCHRAPYDWLDSGDVFSYRSSPATRHVTLFEVRVAEIVKTVPVHRANKQTR